MKITPSPAQVETITGPDSSKIKMKDGSEYFYLPNWFRKNVDGSWDKLVLDDMPEDVRDYVTNMREKSITTFKFFL